MSARAVALSAGAHTLSAGDVALSAGTPALSAGAVALSAGTPTLSVGAPALVADGLLSRKWTRYNERLFSKAYRAALGVLS